MISYRFGKMLTYLFQYALYMYWFYCFLLSRYTYVFVYNSFIIVWHYVIINNNASYYKSQKKAGTPPVLNFLFSSILLIFCPIII